MINSDVVCCFGPPKTGTTWLYNNLVLDSKFSSFNDIKEINLWSTVELNRPKIQAHPDNDPHTVPTYSKEEYFNAIEDSKTPILDFTLCYKEALPDPENVKSFTDRFDVTFICILKDPIDILISSVNFLNMYGLISHSQKPESMQQMIDASKTKYEESITRPGLKNLFGLGQYSVWAPSWEKYNIKYLDYDRLNEANYVNKALDIDIQYPIQTSNVTKNKKLRKDRMNPGTLQVLQNFYQTDIDYISALKDKYK